MTQDDSEAAKRQAFERLTRELRPDLYRYAFWLSRDPHLAEDVVQDALMRGWRSLDSLKDEGAAKQWLLTIVRREHARAYERKRLETTDIDALSGAEQRMLASTTDTDLADVRRAIFRLDDDYREPLVLQVLMGHTAEEIAQLMDLTTGAVLTRLFRARKKLKDALGLVETS